MLRYISDTLAVILGILLIPATAKSSLANPLEVVHCEREIELVIPDPQNPGKNINKRGNIVLEATQVHRKATYEWYDPATQQLKPVKEELRVDAFSKRAVVFRGGKAHEVVNNTDLDAAIAFQSVRALTHIIYPEVIDITTGAPPNCRKMPAANEESLTLPSVDSTNHP